MPAFIPTAYTARDLVFYPEPPSTDSPRVYSAHEAVMQLADRRHGAVKVMTGDGLVTWCDPEDIYRGARRGC